MSQQKTQCLDEDWRRIAAEAASETNPEKLSRIIKELCDALDKRHPQNQGPSDMPDRKSAGQLVGQTIGIGKHSITQVQFSGGMRQFLNAPARV